jgi:DHA1 family multidrug resistance protein-like MFS transporter
VFPLFGHALFVNLGLGPGCTLLAGLSIIMIPPLYLLYRYGAKLRVKSKYATA